MKVSLRRLSRFYMPHIRFLYLGLFLLVFAAGLGIAYPYLLRTIVNQVIENHHYGELPWLVGAILAAAIVKGVFQFGQAYSSQVFGSLTGFDLRNALYHKLNHQSFTFLDDMHTGDLMSRLTADLDAVRMFLSFGINNLMNLFLLVCFSIGFMLYLNVWLALVLIGLMPILAFIAIRFGSHLRPAFSRVRVSLGTLNSGVQENLMGMRTVKSFAQEPHEIGKFGDRNDAYFDANIGTAVLWRRYFPLMESIGNFGVVLILFIGGLLVMKRVMNLGDLVAFLSILWTIIWPMAQLGFFLNNLTQAVAAGDRLLELLEAENDIEPVDRPHSEQAAGSAVDKRKVAGKVSFDNVSVTYGDETVLKDIQVEVQPGETVALLGLTGAGKSTLVNLLPRFYDVSKGNVRIDDKDVREWDIQELRRSIAMVFQEPFLFSTTIFANIAYGRPDASMEDVRRAAAIADAEEFISQMPDGYYTLVGERGMGLSGGQKQRIALARAILQDPSILILDDATSAVDMETEYEIQQALQRVLRDRTTFVIAHRISTLKRANQIFVIDGGRIVQRGVHDELLRQEGLYQEIFSMQFQDFESLENHGNAVGSTGRGNRS
ncbi:ABC transporter ATP-binding protein [Alicyclobacillus sp. SO9]|uniref:ABC transporter ATP-binding protein n=1 Tax=Alicyclobacillus sp. SO9 TaxID=2665646 RepID=UPI0018E87BFD|nr:ABC transporter ATP-binding protein [Alicyclobacillus sp. SO9]QQE77867.1 ABC transporter ATP-binding protein [Alicyclobacillus sp. SO9]